MSLAGHATLTPGALVRAVQDPGLVDAAYAIWNGSKDSPVRRHMVEVVELARRIDKRSVKHVDGFQDAIVLGALLTWLVEHVNEEGTLSLKSVRRAAADSGASITGALLAAQHRKPRARPNYNFLSDVVQGLQLTVGRERGLDVVNAFMRHDDLLPRRLAALDAVTAQVASDRFEKQGLVAVQHLLPTSLPLFEALIEAKMAPERIHVLGTPYGTNPLVVAVLRLMGVDAWPGYDRDAVLPADFEAQRIEEIYRFVAARLHDLDRARPEDGYIVLDDGGLLQLVLSGDRWPASWSESERKKWCACLARIFPDGNHAVEQTSRGMTELRKKGPRFATVSVALCPSKVEGEARVVGLALAKSIRLILAQRALVGPQRVILIGAGSVGASLAQRLLEQGHEVSCVDSDEARRASIRAQGFSASEALTPELLSEATVVVGCVGKTSVDGDRLGGLGGFNGVLISASSMAIEFNEAELSAYRGRTVDVAMRARPANFDGTGFEHLTPEQIGLTRALLFAALAQPVTTRTAGFLPVEPALEKAAYDAWIASGGDRIRFRPRHPDTLASRPDRIGARGRARHDEWMCYLLGLERPVIPRPADNVRTPGFYFFADHLGVRLVDTHRGGASVRVALPSVPRCVYRTQADSDASVLVECGPPRGTGACELFEVSASGQVRKLGPVDEHVATLFRMGGADYPLAGPRYADHAFIHGRILRVSMRGDRHSMKVITLPDDLNAKETSFHWVHDDVIVAFDRSCGKVYPLALSTSSDAAKVRETIRCPSEIVKIEAEACYDSPQFGVRPLIVVGRDKGDRLMFAVVAPVGCERAVPLPPSAVLRALREKPGALPGVFEIGYTLPGDSVESDALRTLTVDALENLRLDAPAMRSAIGVLREALTT
ncbi:MAG: NAD(P)-binding domain-containing protein [Deltaproteobacteria bacterium]|nr:NAD(P)-binding domain-containing protein [Deltaproteobacteria bacterium]